MPALQGRLIHAAVAMATLLVAVGCGPSRATADDIVLTYREEVGWCDGCPEFELEFRRGFLRFHGLNACSAPVTVTTRVPPERFEPKCRTTQELLTAAVAARSLR